MGKNVDRRMDQLAEMMWSLLPKENLQSEGTPGNEQELWSFDSKAQETDSINTSEDNEEQHIEGEVGSGGLVVNPVQDDIPLDSNLGQYPTRLQDLVFTLDWSRMRETTINNKIEDCAEEDVDGASSEETLFSAQMSLKVILHPSLEILAFESKSEGTSQLVVDLVESTGITLSDVKMSSAEILGIHSAHKLFDELPMRKTEVNGMNLSSTVVYLGIKIMVDGSCLIMVDNMGLVFDPGGVVDHGRSRFDSSYAAGLVHIWSELVWVFDPGGGLTSIDSCADAFC